MLKTAIMIFALIWGISMAIGVTLIIGSRYSRRIRTFVTGDDQDPAQSPLRY